MNIPTKVNNNQDNRTTILVITENDDGAERIGHRNTMMDCSGLLISQLIRDLPLVFKRFPRLFMLMLCIVGTQLANSAQRWMVYSHKRHKSTKMPSNAHHACFRNLLGCLMHGRTECVCRAKSALRTCTGVGGANSLADSRQLTCSGNLVERLPFKNLGQSKLGRKGGKTPNGQRSGIPCKFETPYSSSTLIDR